MIKRMRVKRKNKSNKGFTLVELMVSIAILLLVGGATLLTLTHCILLNESNNNLVTAACDAEFVLEQIKELSYGDISSYVPPSLTNLHNETITVTRAFDTGIVEVTIDVGWTERQRERTFSLPTRIAQ